VSHFTAQLTVALFGLLLGMTAYRLARMLFAPLAALGATLMLLGAPEMASWGRQVMLDIPVHAVALLAVVEFVQYLRSGRERYLWLAVLAFAAVDRIPPVGLDPLARLSRDQRWRDDGAFVSRFGELSLNPVTAWAGFITKPQLSSRSSQLHGQCPQGTRRVGDLPVLAHFSPQARCGQRHRYRIFVHVKADIGNRLRHDPSSGRPYLRRTL
jgi:hypothetical protein